MSTKPPASAHGQALLAQLEALREQGLAEQQPVQFHYLQRLAERLAASPRPPSERTLQRWQQALTQCRPSPLQPPAAARESRQLQLIRQLRDQLAQAQPNTPTVPRNPLDALLADQEQRVLADFQGGSSPSPQPEPGTRPALKALHGLRLSQANLTLQQRIERAIHQAPSDAGPLNSHRLVSRALGTLEQIAPAYLQRLVKHLDTLHWLEQQSGKKKGS